MDELIFQYLPIELDLKAPFGLLKRGMDTAVVLVRNKNGQWVLGRKDSFYPEGIVRMIGGGMDDGNPLGDIQRELKEELAVEVEEDRLKPLIHAEIIGRLPDGEQVTTSVFVFYLMTYESLVAGDDLSGLAYLSDHDMHDLIGRYGRLPESGVIRKDEPDGTWADYGKIWGPIHAAALERVKELGL